MRNGKSQIKKNKKGERVAEGDGKRAKKLTLAPSRAKRECKD